MDGPGAPMEYMRRAYKILTGRPERMKPLEKLRHWWTLKKQGVKM
jgi:hypothetical protein